MEFFYLIPDIQKYIFKIAIIKAAFAETGLYLFNSEKVVRVYILDPAALATSSQALSVFLAVWRRRGGIRYMASTLL